jgi:H+-transporting ATPase
MIWIAIFIELAKGILTGAGWEDFGVLVVLQFANAIIGFMEEKNSGDAVEALRSALKPVAYALRNGEWGQIASRELVPGDVIEVKLGDVMPADCVLLASGTQLQMDQAALTGESLPVERKPWERLLMSSAVKRGEAKAMVADTGLNTEFGKAAGLIASVQTVGNLQKVLLRVTLVLSALSILLCIAIYIKLWYNDENALLMVEGANKGKVLACLSVAVVILVASIPIAIEVVCTSTLAVGSHRMAAMKVIVSRLSAIEELASMEILCSDKTGTLTQNKLTLYDPIFPDKAAPCTADNLNMYAFLASKKEKGSQDAIDFCIMNNVSPAGLERVHKYKEIEFVPFNPTDKKTLFRSTNPEGLYEEVSKGAPHVILKMCHNAASLGAAAELAVQELADRGFRSLAVARNLAGEGNPPKWEHMGILSLFDPPRTDTLETIREAHEYNIDVKMVTGDHTAIAMETSRNLELGTQILNTQYLGSKVKSTDPAVRKEVNDAIVMAEGFAEVMPEHKFLIVERIREAGYMTGMTGDGVNDAPALKRADVGIAVEGATDAARAAADLVLTEPGLSVIIKAIFESRCIFQRMRNYIVYRIACTIQLLFFFFFAIMCIDPSTEYMYGSPKTSYSVAGVTKWWDGTGAHPSGAVGCETATSTSYAGTIPGTELCHGPAFTLPVIAMVIITILNDGCMITSE